jgi:hypothetical protein
MFVGGYRLRVGVSETATSIARATVDVATDVARKVRSATGRVLAALPRDAGTEVVASVRRLQKVRTPREAVEAFETETERLLTVVMPPLVEHPLPIRNRAAAKAVVASAGGLAAAGEEIETIAALTSGGVAISHTLPVMIAANLTALAVEFAVAASLRVHALRDAGIDPRPNEVAVDVVTAMTGRHDDQPGMTRYVTKKMVKEIAARVLSRWGAAFVPVAGIAYSGWDAQRTIDAVLALELPPAAADRAAPAPAISWATP